MDFRLRPLPPVAHGVGVLPVLAEALSFCFSLIGGAELMGSASAPTAATTV
jgi:hypothetical protein